MSRQNSDGIVSTLVPDNEEARLEALYRYDILNNAPKDANLDHITRLAARLFQAPTAVISLIDRDRQCLKAAVGIDPADTDRKVSFCTHVVYQGTTLVVPDTHKDPRFRDNPSVTGEPFFRFYTGAPLITSEGYSLGSLCVLDTQPRKAPTAEEIAMLEGLAQLVVDEFELRSTSSELRRRRDELETMQQLLDLALAASMTGVWRWDAGDEHIRLHPTAARLLDLPGDQETIGLGELTRHVQPEDRQRLLQGLAEAGRGRGTVTREVRIEDRNSNQRWLEIAAEGHVGEEGGLKYFVGTIHDITPQRQSAIGIEHLERLAAVGTLAAGVGHELNNPLTFVQYGIDFARETLDRYDAVIAAMTEEVRHDFSEARQGLIEAREGAERIRDIVAELRRFGQPAAEHLEPTDVVDALEFALRIATELIQSRARVVRDYEEEIPLVDATKTLLSQVFINLLVNAAQAIEPGQPSEERIHVRISNRGSRVCVEISDTGQGIEPQILPRIFDPFFTTRAPNEGTGLGLPTTLRIVRCLEGELDIHSAPGKGTTVRITLPASQREDMIMPDTNVNALPTEEHERKPRLLFIDDEPRIGEAFRRLTRRYYESVTTTRADEALQWIEEGQRFDVIFSDLFMPDMTGAEFYEALRDIAPDLARRVVFMTGGAFTDKARRLIEQDNVPHLYKPFDRIRLDEAVAQILTTH
jgi:signal transduction histidine kinase